jgi:hypothetical protein
MVSGPIPVCVEQNRDCSASKNMFINANNKDIFKRQAAVTFANPNVVLSNGMFANFCHTFGFIASNFS